MPENRRALIIASDQFADPKLKRLRSPSVDARALARVLGDPSIGDFAVSLSFNETESVVRRRLSRFLIEAKRDDLLVLHMACHGVKDEEGNLHFAMTDTDTKDLYATAVGADFVERLMARSPSRRIVLLLDCCYSGAFAPGMQVRGDPEVHVLERFTGRGRAVLTASSAMEYAWEADGVSGTGMPSVFTSAVVRGLDTGEADRDGDGQISVDELYDYVLESVRQVTPNQTPNKQIQMEGDLFLAKSVRGPRPVLTRLPPEVLEAARSPLAGVREGVVLDLARLLESDDGGQARAAEAILKGMLQDDSRRVSTAAAAALGKAAVDARRDDHAQPVVDSLPRGAGHAPLMWPSLRSRAWWDLGLRAVAALAAGVVTATSSPPALFIGILAIYGVVHGVLELVLARTGGAMRLWRGAEGASCILLSALVVWIYAQTELESDPTPELVVLVLFCLIVAAMDVALAWQLDGDSVQRRSLMLSGLAWALFGGMIAIGVSGLSELDEEARVIRLQVVGGLASLCGVVLLGMAWWLRSAAQRAMQVRTG